MKFKVDENMSLEVRDLLRREGHDAIGVREQELGGASDAALAEVCRVEDRILVTLDVDFANVRAFPPARYAGIVVVRVATPTLDTITSVVRRWLSRAHAEDPRGRLWIVDERRIRIHEPIPSEKG